VRTIAFYSYKGGVGRTLALANAGIRLSRLGYRVVTLDLDLEAPGLHHKWNLDPRRKPLTIERGLVDILYGFVTQGSVPKALDGYLLDVSDPGDKRGSIHFLPAGTAPSATYSKRLARIDWHALFHREDSEGILFFRELKELIRKEYTPDFLLIDARTGFTDMGGVATTVLADQVFCLMLNNHEHLEGSRAVMRGMLDAHRLQDEPPVKLGAILARYRRTRDDVAEARDKESVQAYLNEPADNLGLTLTIPEVIVLRAETTLEQQERLLLLDSDHADHDLPLLRDYLGLCSWIVPTDDRQRPPSHASVPPPPVEPANPSAIPPHNLPPRRTFVGRDEELIKLASELAEGRRATILPTGQATLYGLGGVGKTALALEYAHRALERGDYPGGVWWLEAEGKPVEALLRLAGVLRAGAPEPIKAELRAEILGTAELADTVRFALQNHPAPSLLVLDNVSEPSWKDLLPGGEVRVLVTTRDEHLALGRRAPLGVLPPEQAVELAIRLMGSAPRNPAEEAVLDRVVNQELGGLAVAVEAAARAVERWASTWTAYDELLYWEAKALLKRHEPHRDYPHRAAAALDLSIKRCRRGTPARRLLEGAAVFAPDAVPLDWAEAAAGLNPGGIKAREARKTLMGLGLITVDEEAQNLSMHRLVHRRVRERASKKNWPAKNRRAAKRVGDWLMGTVGPTRMAEVDARRAHIDAALVAAELCGSALDWIGIADRLGEHLRHRAAYEDARTWFEQALARAEQLDPPNPAEVGTSLSNLALALKDLGRPAEARLLYERALAIAEKTHGSDHPYVTTVLSNLALALKDLGQAAEARPLLERALSIHEKTYGPDHPTVAIRLLNLAMVLSALGQPAEARPLLERALSIDEKTYGPDHPIVATFLSNLASVLMYLDQPDEGRLLLERALSIQEKAYGPHHPDVARTLSNLAITMERLGDQAGALPLHQRALAIAEKTLPPGHPLRITIAEKLASS
jgi:tetratricopeptide (TPR) repeat protein/cellulose biosynthesis protein BcsQ